MLITLFTSWYAASSCSSAGRQWEVGGCAEGKRGPRALHALALTLPGCGGDAGDAAVGEAVLDKQAAPKSCEGCAGVAWGGGH